ncbi:MAG: M18 family aminopeptidase [Erysipelotrichaceae bacterium]|nr:M18 family aminopeptidase [Erysipelotrichaceae bacterium]
MSIVEEMIDFLADCPTSYQSTVRIEQELNKEGYVHLSETKPWDLKKGGKYYVTRNGSSILAFNIGKELKEPSFKIVASHSDCPGFKVKPHSLIKDGKTVKLNTEPYGGLLHYPWLDRPLSLAGRVIVETEKGIEIYPLQFHRPLCVIPSLAIHMNREVNNGHKFNPQLELMPLISNNQDFDLEDLISTKLGVSKEAIVNYDLYLYPCQKGFVWGAEGEFVSAHHLDDMQCGFTSLKGFINTFEKDSINVYVCFDNEEVGSVSRMGADGKLLETALDKIAEAFGFDVDVAISRGMLVSADNAQGFHPNYPQKYDPTNRCYLNEGIALKYNANMSYTSDGLSGAIFSRICKKGNIPYQIFTNRSDERGGSTLGKISFKHVSILSIDVGIPQLAMHSPIETSGVKDIQGMIDAIHLFMASSIKYDGEYGYILK